ncbi:hypothetical protein MBLNU459_g1726t1 [Dothideomycetes sp. NU459]
MPPQRLQFASERLLEMILHFNSARVNLSLYRDAWFKLSLLDDAAHHQVNALLFSHLLTHHPVTRAIKGYKEATYNERNNAVRILNERLSDPELRYSDGVIAAIVASISEAHVYGDLKSFDTHANGLKLVIEQRGGLQTLDSNPMLQSMVSYFDAIGACVENRSPYYPLPANMPDLNAFCADVTIHPILHSISEQWRFRMPAYSAQIDILIDVTRFLARVKQDVSGRLWANGMWLGSFMLGLVHRLSSIRHLSDVSTSDFIISECGKIAIMLAIAEPRRRIGVPAAYQHNYLSRLQGYLENFAADWTGLELLKLWMLAAGAKEAYKEVGGNWFYQRMIATMQDLAVTQGWGLHTQRQLLESIDSTFLSTPRSR